ncbi:MAG: hypothetical protein VR68_09990 [Peptococcaceae bacterium BRH_c4a]|nr:MAG: hypothetical protein VR68_09990 [Peptococcaceae bacterium BRH_c4a]
MKKYYSQGKRFISLSMERWKEMRAGGKYLRYYIKPSRSHRNALARNIDFYGLLFIALLVTFAFLTAHTGSAARGLLLSVPLMVLEIFFAFRIRRVLENVQLDHHRIWVAGLQCQERIKKIETADGLNILLVEILEKMPGFSDVHIVKDRPEDDHRQSGSTAIRALYRGIPVAVASLVEEGDNISADKVLQFQQEIKKLDMPAGIMMAAGIFSGEARRAALEGKKKIALVDLYRLVDLARISNHSIFPALLGEMKANGGKVSHGYKKLFRNALGREKARSYFLSAGLMMTMYFTSLWQDFWGAAYLLFGILNLALALYCIISNRERDLFPVG